MGGTGESGGTNDEPPPHLPGSSDDTLNDAEKIGNDIFNYQKSKLPF
jgi:hypothetical protein